MLYSRTSFNVFSCVPAIDIDCNMAIVSKGQVLQFTLHPFVQSRVKVKQIHEFGSMDSAACRYYCWLPLLKSLIFVVVKFVNSTSQKCDPGMGFKSINHHCRNYGLFKKPIIRHMTQISNYEAMSSSSDQYVYTTQRTQLVLRPQLLVRS